MQEREKRLHEYEPLWGQWQLGCCLYNGGASAVFDLRRVRCDQELSAVVKLVELRAAAGDLPIAFARAMDEIEVTERLAGCRNIVALRDDLIQEVRDAAGRLAGYDILIRMDRLTCLADLLREGQELPEQEVRKLGVDMCAALAFAHTKGIIHRDIKPANIYRNAAGDYLLGDFGVSARSGGDREVTAGTSAYMAPEAARGGRYDFRADVYSLGLVMYQLLNHHHLPLTDDDSTYSQRHEALSRRRAGARLPAPVLGSPRLRQVVFRACQSDPERRYATASAMAQDLIGAGGVKKGKRPRPGWLIAGLCLLCLLAGGAAAHWLWPAVLLNRPTTDSSAVAAATAEQTPGKSRYEVIKTNMTWENAKVYCESRGGHLATIATREEESTITALLGEARVSAVWLGANNRNSAKGFQWLTGERFSYAPWGLNEPNNTNGVEYYLMMQFSNGEWVWNDSRDDGLDNFDQDQVGFVCEWDNADDQ